MDKKQKIEEANARNLEKWYEWSKKGYVDLMYWISLSVLFILSCFIIYIMIWSNKKFNFKKDILTFIFPLGISVTIIPMLNKYRKKNIHKLKNSTSLDD